MAAPATTARVTPSGRALWDGMFSKISFSLDSNISFWETSVKPFGQTGGEPIDTTTHHNVLRRTKMPRSLIDVTNATFVARYHPTVLTQIAAILNQEGSVTIIFFNGDTYDAFAYLMEADPQDMSEGNPPELNGTVVSTNWDPVNNVESGPVLTEGTMAPLMVGPDGDPYLQDVFDFTEDDVPPYGQPEQLRQERAHDTPPHMSEQEKQVVRQGPDRLYENYQRETETVERFFKDGKWPVEGEKPDMSMIQRYMRNRARQGNRSRPVTSGFEARQAQAPQRRQPNR